VEREASQVRGPALANLLLALPAEAGELPAGTEVTAWWLDDGA
jgi:molybdopterin molybdotransferase